MAWCQILWILGRCLVRQLPLWYVHSEILSHTSIVAFMFWSHALFLWSQEGMYICEINLLTFRA